LVRSTLAIYITLFAVAGVAFAQILYWKLVVAREPACAEEACAAEWLPDSLGAWPEFEIEAVEPQFAAEPVLAAA
jgi:hypothetical protein